MEAQNFASFHRSKWFIGHTKSMQNLDLPQTFTALHKNLYSPSSTATAASKDGISPSPLPLFSAPCWKTLTMKGSRGKGSACVLGPELYLPLQLPQGITHAGTVGCSASSCTDMLRTWSWIGTFYYYRSGWEIWSKGFSLVSIA